MRIQRQIKFVIQQGVYKKYQKSSVGNGYQVSALLTSWLAPKSLKLMPTTCIIVICICTSTELYNAVRSLCPFQGNRILM